MRRMPRLLVWTLCLLSAGITVVRASDREFQPATVAAVAAVAAVEANIDTPTERIDSLLVHAISMIGVKYRFGGSSFEDGFDCSGFVRHVFAETLAFELPRSSLAISKLGATVERAALLPGDLVFYNTLRRRYSHVGIYLGEGRFIHAPSRGKAVEIVDMSDRYWERRYNGARRLVER